jgi:hypothetical protein
MLGVRRALIGLPLLPFLFRRHVMTNNTAAGRADNTVMRHVASDTADDGAFDAALGLGRSHRAGDQGESGDG